jgi:hypothetical protein
VRVGNVTFASTRVRTCAAPPANDNFASAKALSGRTGSVGGSTVLATTETGEVHVDLGGGGDDLGFSVWYRWSAPARGRLELSVPALAPEGFETVVAVFVNAPTQVGLRRVASSGFDRCPGADAADTVCVNMQVDQSVTYAIAVGAFDGMPGPKEGSFNLAWSLKGSAGPPRVVVASVALHETACAQALRRSCVRAVSTPNDFYSARQLLTGASGSVVGTTVDATADLPLQPHGVQTVWYRWIAPRAGRLSWWVEPGRPLAGIVFADLYRDFGTLALLEELPPHEIHDVSDTCGSVPEGSICRDAVVQNAVAYTFSVVSGVETDFTFRWRIEP